VGGGLWMLGILELIEEDVDVEFVARDRGHG
jgi:hypothetical protein